jgi:hypothetical protein
MVQRIIIAIPLVGGDMTMTNGAGTVKDIRIGIMVHVITWANGGFIISL